MGMQLRTIRGLALAVTFLALVGCAGPEPAPEPKVEPEAQVATPEPTPEPTPDEQVAALEAMCADAQEAMQACQAETMLYERLGGRDAIHGVVADVVQRHLVNEQIKNIMVGVDTAKLVEQVTDFLSEASGGDVPYTGSDMVTAHAHLALTNADFLAAGNDVQAAMVAGGVGQNEIQEVMCMFVSLRGEVVTQ